MITDASFAPRTLLTEAEDREIRDQVHAAIAAGGAAPQIRRRILDRCQRAIDANAYAWVYSSWEKGVSYPYSIANFNSHGSSLRTGVAILRRQFHIGRKRPYREMLSAVRLVRSGRAHTVLQADMYGDDWHDPNNPDAAGYRREAALQDILVSAWPFDNVREEIFWVGAFFGRAPGQPPFTRHDAAIADAFMFHAQDAMKADLPTRFVNVRRVSRKALVYFICYVFEATHAAGPDHADVAAVNNISPGRAKKMLAQPLQVLGFKNRKRLWAEWARQVLGLSERTVGTPEARRR